MTINIGGDVYYPAELEMINVDDSVLINNTAKNISIILNQTSSKIWEIIIESQKTKKNISCGDIVDSLMKYYSLNQLVVPKINDDVEKVIIKFINTGMLIKCTNNMLDTL